MLPLPSLDRQEPLVRTRSSPDLLGRMDLLGRWAANLSFQDLQGQMDLLDLWVHLRQVYQMVVGLLRLMAVPISLHLEWLRLLLEMLLQRQ